MAQRTVVHRISWARARDELVPALERAREEASLEPLRSLLDVDRLDRQQFILTGRRYLVFGPEDHKLIGSSTLLADGLVALAEESVDLGEAPEAIVDALRASGEHPTARARFEELLGPDHGTPAWLRGNQAPSLVSPEEVAELRAVLPEVLALPAVASDPDLARAAAELSALLTRCVEGSPAQGLGVVLG